MNHFERVLCRLALSDEQVVVQASLQQLDLQISHYSKMAEHSNGRILYHFRLKSFHRPTMAVECSAVAKNCVACSINCVLLRRNQKPMQLLPAKAPLELVSIDILGQLVKSSRGNNLLLVITDRYSKLVRTVTLKSVTAASVAKALVTSRVLTYGPPKWVLSNNGKQLAARFFQHVCTI